MPPTEKQNREFALVLIRVVSRRLKLIDEEITATGTALSQERLSSREALRLVEEIAPGCVDAVFLSLYDGVSPEQLQDARAKAAAGVAA
jgi:hypothetical protein